MLEWRLVMEVFVASPTLILIIMMLSIVMIIGANIF